MGNVKPQSPASVNAVVSPVIGEFGWMVFDILPKVNHLTQMGSTYVWTRADWAWLFEDAGATVHVIPDEVMPTVEAEFRSVHHLHWRQSNMRGRLQVERLVRWWDKQIAPIRYRLKIDIPYFTGSRWAAPQKHALIQAPMTGCDPYIVLHARDEPRGKHKNWAHEKWDELADWLNGKGHRIYTIGDSYIPKAAEAFSDSPSVEVAVIALSNAEASISSNSGPTHLSLYCGCPTFSFGDPNLKDRVMHDTNPLGTFVDYFGCGWDPEVSHVKDALEHFEAACSTFSR